ncbi:putative ubiquitin family protein-2 [Elsinoe australis]|uniref:Putative ubiquitin family protein-2 n=1 Tax=Elsinoe australis TaxID=40998 RepID=A0A4U7AQ47_9PEZI|nr:putative ubiquitin family protein-2 [Elsinoe australis]
MVIKPSEPLALELKADHILVNKDLKISFHRTVRVPDNHKTSALPPDLGSFPLQPISGITQQLPLDMASKGGIFFPMYQSEAMWIKFSQSCRENYAIRVYLGGVNAISGALATGTVMNQSGRQNKQDYLVVPGQRWLDGIADSNGSVRQFVAMHAGSEYSVEAQVSGQDAVGGLQIEVTPYTANSRGRPFGQVSVSQQVSPKFDDGLDSEFEVTVRTLTGKVLVIVTSSLDTVDILKRKIAALEWIPPDQQRLIYAGKRLEDGRTLGDQGITAAATLYLTLRLRGGGHAVLPLAVAAGGSIEQVIHPDRNNSELLARHTTVFNVQILNSVLYEHVTGNLPPGKPLSVSEYKDYGFPFFKVYEEPSGITGKFGGVKSIGQIDGIMDGHVVPNTVALGTGDSRRKKDITQVSLLNPLGPLLSFRPRRNPAAEAATKTI